MIREGLAAVAPEQRRGHIGCSYWPRRMRKQDRRKRGSACSPRRWLWRHKTERWSTKRSCIGCGES